MQILVQSNSPVELIVNGPDDGKRPDVAESLHDGQLGRRPTGRRLGGDVVQLMDDDDRQHSGRQRVEDADRPHVDVSAEHVRQQAPVDRQRAAAVTSAETDGGRVLERGDESDGDQEERDEETSSVGGDAAVEIETVMITTIDTATTQSTVAAVCCTHRLTTTHKHCLVYTRLHQ